MCHSVVWLASSRSCHALLAIAHGARRDDWCWHPALAHGATTSIRLPGEWEGRAVDAAARVLRASSFLRSGTAPGPRVFRKRGRYPWTTPAGHQHPLERSIEPVACEPGVSPGVSPGGRSSRRHKREGRSLGRNVRMLEVSDVLVGAIPLGDPRPGKSDQRSTLSCPR